MRKVKCVEVKESSQLCTALMERLGLQPTHRLQPTHIYWSQRQIFVHYIKYIVPQDLLFLKITFCKNVFKWFSVDSGCSPNYLAQHFTSNFKLSCPAYPLNLAFQRPNWTCYLQSVLARSCLHAFAQAVLLNLLWLLCPSPSSCFSESSISPPDPQKFPLCYLLWQPQTTVTIPFLNYHSTLFLVYSDHFRESHHWGWLQFRSSSCNIFLNP